MDKFFSVEELAKTGNTTARTVRLYIDKGLLEPMRIGRILCFPEATRQTLEDIQRAKRLGFSLKEIKSFQTVRNIAVVEGAIHRIEELMADAEIEVTHLRRLLAHLPKKR